MLGSPLTLSPTSVYKGPGRSAGSSLEILRDGVRVVLLRCLRGVCACAHLLLLLLLYGISAPNRGHINVEGGETSKELYILLCLL